MTHDRSYTFTQIATDGDYYADGLVCHATQQQ